VKRIKTFRLFESVEFVKDMVEDLLRDFSDDDIPVDVEIYQPDPNSEESNLMNIL